MFSSIMVLLSHPKKTCFMHNVFMCAHEKYVCVEEGEGVPVCR